MIVLFFVRVVWQVLISALDAIPFWTVPASLASGGSAYTAFSTVGTDASSMSAWIDFTAVATVIAAMAAVMGVAAAVWLLRRVGAGIPFIGGFFGS